MKGRPQHTVLFWRELVFSGKKDVRLLRHSLFLLSWWMYFSLCDFLYQQPIRNLNASPLYVTTGNYILLKTTLLMLVYAMAAYVFMYIVLPWVIQGKWLKTAGIIIILGLLLFICGDLLYWTIFPFIDSLFGPYKPASFVTWFWPSVYLGLINPTKVLATAGIIKYVKHWWLKQKESEILERELINSELQLLKKQIQPEFLFHSLDSIYEYASKGSALAAGMLLKLSELLSYMLYECDQPFVPLEDEIEMMRKYLSMEKIRLGNSGEMEINVTGDMNGRTIAPFLLLPLIEKSIEQSSKTPGHYWINIDIRIEDAGIHITLANGRDLPGNDPEQSDVEAFVNLEKRLQLLYPHRHQLKISSAEEMQIVHLKLQHENLSVPPIVNGNYLQQEFLHQSI